MGSELSMKLSIGRRLVSVHTRVHGHDYYVIIIKFICNILISRGLELSDVPFGPRSWNMCRTASGKSYDFLIIYSMGPIAVLARVPQSRKLYDAR